MSRSGYTDDCEDVALWRGQVASAIRGRRGQAFLRELVVALNAMPEKRLISQELQSGGEVCALGCLGRAKSISLENVDPEDHYKLAALFNIAHQLVQEVEWWNDEGAWDTETPEQRWQRMLKWAISNLQEPA